MAGIRTNAEILIGWTLGRRVALTVKCSAAGRIDRRRSKEKRRSATWCSGEADHANLRRTQAQSGNRLRRPRWRRWLRARRYSWRVADAAGWPDPFRPSRIFQLLERAFEGRDREHRWRPSPFL